MFARNSDLYLEMSWSCSAFSSRLRLASSTSVFFCSSSRALSFSSPACASSSALERFSSCRSSSVRMLDAIMFRMTPMFSVSWSKKARWIGPKSWKAASSITAFVSPSKRTGSTTTLRGRASPIPEAIEMKSSGTLVSRMRFFSKAHCPMSVSFRR